LSISPLRGSKSQKNSIYYKDIAANAAKIKYGTKLFKSFRTFQKLNDN